MELLIFGTIFAAILLHKNKPVSGVGHTPTDLLCVYIFDATDSHEFDKYQQDNYFYSGETNNANKFWLELISEIKSLGYVENKQTSSNSVRIFWRGDEHISVATKVIDRNIIGI